jgi:hypothetical protein
LVKGTKTLIFQGTSDRDGAVIFNCADEETVERLRSLMTVFTIKEGLQLCVMGVYELPKSNQVVVHVQNPEMTAKEAIELQTE